MKTMIASMGVSAGENIVEEKVDNRSVLTFDESNQSVAQELKNNESIAGTVLVHSALIKTSQSPNTHTNRVSPVKGNKNGLPIREEEEDDA